MKKVVDGKLVEMTSFEIAAKEAEDKINLEGTSEQRMIELRAERIKLLEETDCLALSDVTISNDWKTYRQALRDITKQTPTDMALSNITWPTKPSN
tara:strand:- start:47 stop:334 length:288 start_codon:yes stop_codon:yes gene_type:complete